MRSVRQEAMEVIISKHTPRSHGGNAHPKQGRIVWKFTYDLCALGFHIILFTWKVCEHVVFCKYIYISQVPVVRECGIISRFQVGYF